MGSKVSSKMAAPAARVIQAVRPHAPLIKFPKRHDLPRPNVQEALKTLAVDLTPHNNPAPPPLSRPHVPLTPIPGTPDTLASIQLLPARYRRRPLAAEEMDYIQVRDLHLKAQTHKTHIKEHVATKANCCTAAPRQKSCTQTHCRDYGQQLTGIRGNSSPHQQAAVFCNMSVKKENWKTNRTDSRCLLAS